MSIQEAALVVGTGLVGGNILRALQDGGQRAIALARNPDGFGTGADIVAADLADPASLRRGLAGKSARHVYFATWKPASTEPEACEINARYMRNFFDVARDVELGIEHVSLITGVKHYLGPFADFGRFTPETPFQEDAQRLDLPNFYYAQEDVLFETAARDGFGWSIHRPNSIVGFAQRSLMNMGLTLACYGAICRETGRPFVFPGVPEQWNMVTEVSDARMVAKQAIWAAQTPGAKGLAYNIGNGDVFRWRSMWPVLAGYFGIAAPPYDGQRTSLQALMADAGEIWRSMAKKYGLVEDDVSKLATWWHSDADFGRTVECISDMRRSRSRGFTAYQSSRETFTDLFDQLAEARIIPAFPARN
ncbi:NAD dependent epimerase/dehydratase [Kaistia sp. 32K]|uniref:SDR family oxidoreductase n=1 Tax=Kaistia sp. 32K TaxID=2795690 RepID=UPI001938B8FC|nr:SDR family oxidoreductase [Kaistia sp. 32K]BCP56114.1 NAD dependent epimerase/dehydratase [Kaistia sp. 32K]